MSFDLQDLPKEKELRDLAVRYPEVDVSAIETLLLLLRVGTDLSQAMEATYLKQGLSAGKMSVLMLLLRDPNRGVSPSELATRAGVTRATITGLLDGLEKNDLIRRETSVHDRRGLLVHLTDRSQKLLDTILPGHFIRVSRLMKDLTAEDRKSFVSLLENIKRAAIVFHEN